MRRVEGLCFFLFMINVWIYENVPLLFFLFLDWTTSFVRLLGWIVGVYEDLSLYLCLSFSLWDVCGYVLTVGFRGEGGFLSESLLQDAWFFCWSMMRVRVIMISFRTRIVAMNGIMNELSLFYKSDRFRV